MRVAIVSDAHLGGPGGPADELVAQLDGVDEEDCSHVLFLGDLFHVWVGHQKFETPEVRAVLPAVDRLRARGIRVSYIEGNRDFFLGGSEYEGRFDAVGLEEAFEVGGQRCIAVHGDGLNDRDYNYRFWRWASKNALVRLLALGLPAALASRLVHGTEQRLARSNFKHKQSIPVGPIRRYAEQRLQVCDVLLLGHFHEDVHLELEHGRVWVVDAWFRSRRLVWLPDDLPKPTSADVT